ncbi:putative F-box associated domain, type 1 [Arabidopsis thaliana]
MFDIWITINIEPGHVLWTKFLKVDMETVMETPFKSSESFFIDEKNKIVMGFDETLNPYTISIFGEAGYYRVVNLEQHANTWSRSQMCTYVPSLLQIKQLPLIQVENMFHHLKIQRKNKNDIGKHRYSI